MQNSKAPLSGWNPLSARFGTTKSFWVLRQSLGWGWLVVAQPMESLGHYLLVTFWWFCASPVGQQEYIGKVHQITILKVRMCFSDCENQGIRASSLSSLVLWSTFTAPEVQVPAQCLKSIQAETEGFHIGRLVLCCLSCCWMRSDHKNGSVRVILRRTSGSSCNAWGKKLTFLMFRAKTARSTWERRGPTDNYSTSCPKWRDIAVWHCQDGASTHVRKVRQTNILFKSFFLIRS